MVKIPLKAIPNQQLRVVLGGQNCVIHLYQRGEFMYIDLAADDVAIRTGAICLSGINLLNYKSPDFTGFLFFADMTGNDHAPHYSGLNDRYRLFYDEGA